MSWVDVVIVFGCVASAVVGAWRGLAKEALSLATWLAAIWIAWRFSWLTALLPESLGRRAGGQAVGSPAARVFLLVLAFGGLMAALVRQAIRHTGLTGTDRLLGSLFGLGRGAIVVGLFVIALELAGLDQNAWWQEARLRPYGDRIADGIRHYAALGSRYIQEDLV